VSRARARIPIHPSLITDYLSLFVGVGDVPLTLVVFTECDPCIFWIDRAGDG
jgi:hypothetical protein